MSLLAIEFASAQQWLYTWPAPATASLSLSDLPGWQPNKQHACDCLNHLTLQCQQASAHLAAFIMWRDRAST